MPAASSATRLRSRPASNPSRPRPRSRTAGSSPAVRRVPWDRLARTAMLVVMVAIAYLYLSAGLRLFSAWGQSKRDAAQVRVLEGQNRQLQHQHAVLVSPGSVQTQARALGMVRSGEQSYVVSGLPDN